MSNTEPTTVPTATVKVYTEQDPTAQQLIDPKNCAGEHTVREQGEGFIKFLQTNSGPAVVLLLENGNEVCYAPGCWDAFEVIK